VGAEAHLDTEVAHAVITVPAAFTSAQREATHAAATMAGLQACQPLHEVTCLVMFALPHKYMWTLQCLGGDARLPMERCCACWTSPLLQRWASSETDLMHSSPPRQEFPRPLRFST